MNRTGGGETILVRRAHFGREAQQMGAAANIINQIFQGELVL